MAGESDYKRRLSTHEAELAWISWRRPRLRFAILDNLRRIKRLLSLASGTGRSNSPTANGDASQQD